MEESTLVATFEMLTERLTSLETIIQKMRDEQQTLTKDNHDLRTTLNNMRKARDIENLEKPNATFCLSDFPNILIHKKVNDVRREVTLRFEFLPWTELEGDEYQDRLLDVIVSHDVVVKNDVELTLRVEGDACINLKFNNMIYEEEMLKAISYIITTFNAKDPDIYWTGVYITNHSDVD